MLPITESDPEYAHKVGLRMDGRNIINEWLSDKDSDRARYVWNRRQFKNIDPERTDYLIGWFQKGIMIQNSVINSYLNLYPENDNHCLDIHPFIVTSSIT